MSPCRINHERGSALILTLLSMTVMLAIGLATIGFGGGQRQLAAGERLREATFNIAEATLNAQIFTISRTWPGSSSTAFPTNCTNTTTATNCPDPTTVNSQFTNTEYSGYTWKTIVQDNGGANSNYYTTSVAATQPSYDANGDGAVWVRGQATIRGVTRAVVTQVKAQLTTIPFPRNVMTAGYFGTTTNGKKVIVDTNGSSYLSTPTQPGTVAVRCNGNPGSSCLNYDASKGQVSPPVYEKNYSSAALMTADQLNSLRGTAKANGTWYASGCPASLTGAVVFIESGNCSYNGGTANSLATSGVVIIVSGTLTLGGNATYYGLVYARNAQNSTGNVVTTSGCAKLIGAVAVEGNGGVSAAACGTNIAFNPNALSNLKGYSDPSPVKSTWREVGS